MRQEDLQQISDLLDNKLDQKFKENNKVILIKIDEVKKQLDKFEDDITRTTKEGFDETTKLFKENTKQHEEMNFRLTKVETGNSLMQQTITNWADKEIHDLSDDMDRMKFIHRKEWKKLPDIITVRKAVEAV